METNPASELPANEPANNSLAIVSLVLGIAGLPLFCITFIFGWFCSCFMGLFAIGAILSGLLARYQIKSTGQQGENMALIGIILGCVQCMFVVFSLLLSVVPFVFSRIQQ